MDNERLYLSVIIPFYNSSNDVLKLLASIEWGYPSFEVILVDDGSIDGSRSLVENAVLPFDNVRLVTLLCNKGASAARNRGIDSAHGDYIWFVDSDDKIALGALPALLRFLRTQSEPFEMLFFGWTNVIQNMPLKLEILPSELSFHAALENVFKGNGYIWNKIFNRQSLDSSGVRFDESIFWAEDKLFCANFIAHTKGIILQTDKQLYVHTKRAASFTSSKKADSKHLSLLAAEGKLAHLAKCCGEWNLLPIAERQLVRDSLMMMARLLVQRPEGWRNQFIACWNGISGMRNNALLRKDLSIKHKAFLLLCSALLIVINPEIKE